MKPEIKRIKFQEVQPFWVYKLWPGRHSAIETHSAMQYQSEQVSAFNFLCPVWYHGCFVKDQLIGVNSIHMCDDNTARSRGLWVDEEHRGKGYGKSLLLEAIDMARKSNAKAIWSYPRKTSWPTYEAAGFLLTSDWKESETSEANAYCIMEIK